MKTKLSKLIITLLILITFIISPLLSNRADEFEFMKEVVEKNHKNFFNTVSKEECEEEYKDIMQSYVNNFAKFKSKGKGLILCGKVGTGKTFLASCVANALIDKGVKVLMTNLREIESGVWENKQQYIDSLNSYSLLVIDDLGVERNTEYMQELMYGVVNSRYAAGLPMIITTNLTIEELKRPKDIGSSRIYERILERCYPIEVKGTNKRRMIIRNEYDETRELLGIKKGEQNG